MKTREIKAHLTNMGYERGSLYVLEAINEKVNQQSRDLKELAHMFDKMIDSMDGMMTVAGNMKDKLTSMEEKEDGLGPNTQGLGRDE